MPLRTVEDIMSTSMVVLDEDLPLPTIAHVLADRGAPAAPVISDDGCVVGIVTGLDLLRRTQWYRPHRRWRTLGRRRDERRRERQQTAGELMTSPAVTARIGDHLRQVAHVMVRNHLSSLPVVDDDGRLLGVVTREDLLREFTVPDDQIREEVERHVVERLLWSEPHDVRVEVDNGVVTLYGGVARRSMAAVAAACTRNLSGVAGVVDQLTYETDDTVATAIRPG